MMKNPARRCVLGIVVFLVLFAQGHGEETVQLQELVKPQDIEYEIRLWFEKKLSEKELKSEVKRIEKTYGLKAVRRDTLHSFEFVSQQPQSYTALAEKIRKENNNIVLFCFNPLVSESHRIIYQNRIVVFYKKSTSKYQLNLIQEYFQLKPAGPCWGIKMFDSLFQNKIACVEYELNELSLAKTYNALRKVGIIVDVDFRWTAINAHELAKITGIMQIHGISVKSKKRNRLAKTLTLFGKTFRVIPFHPECPCPREGYMDKVVHFRIKATLTQKKMQELLKNHQLSILGFYGPFQGAMEYWVEILSNKSVDETIELLNKDPHLLGAGRFDISVID